MTQQRPTTTLPMSTLASAIVMLAASLLLPLVSLASYRWTVTDLPHKIGCLMDEGIGQAVAYILLLGLLLAPLALAVSLLLRRHAGKTLHLLPAVVAILLTAALLLSSHLMPGWGLWLYLFFALVPAVQGFQRLN